MSNRLESFRKKYEGLREPWSYSHRAIETVRHEFVRDRLQQILLAPCSPVLEIGCGLGHLTQKILPVAHDLTALDLVPEVLEKTRERCESSGSGKRSFVVGSVTELPFPDSSFEIVLAIDGLHSWELEPDQKRRALSEIHRVLRPGGRAILMDYLHPSWLEDAVGYLRASSLKLESIEYFGDRPWYQFESAFKALGDRAWVRGLLSNVPLARLLRGVGSLLGPAGSTHLIAMFKKPSSP